MNKLQAHEVKLQATLKHNGFEKQNDTIGERIQFLISNYLIEIATDSSGWFKLFRDPADNRYWELSYPESELQRGGAALLVYISEHDAKAKYNFPLNKWLK